MAEGSGVFSIPALPGTRGLVAIDDRGHAVEWYLATAEAFDEEQEERMRRRLFAWNASQRALKLLR